MVALDFTLFMRIVFVTFLVVLAFSGTGFVGLVAWEIICPGPDGFNLSRHSALAVFCGALTALTAWCWSIIRQESEDLLKEAQDFYKKAFDTLNVLDDEGRPRNERMRWLTAARLLTTAKQLGNRVSLKSHKTIHAEVQEYWRHRFRDLILPSRQGFPKQYFADKVEHLFAHTSRNRAPISLTSATVLYRFIEWPEGRTDPIDSEEYLTHEDAERMSKFGPVALGQLIKQYLELRKK